MIDVLISVRNLWRNPRRSFATVAAISLACAGLMLFGGYIVWIHRAGESQATGLFGSLQVFKEGFAERGMGDPAAFAIEDFEGLRERLWSDPELAGELELVTGQLSFAGLVQCAETGGSAPCAGVGMIPEDLERMLDWNPYGLTDIRSLEVNRHLFEGGPELSPDDPGGGTLGVGLARLLGLEFGATDGVRPELELISLPPGGGLPNVVTIEVRRATARGLEGLDHSQVVVPLELASSLLFPGEPVRASSVMVVVRDRDRLDAVVRRVEEISRSEGRGLEVRTGEELHPTYQRSMAMLDMFFLFALAIVSAVLVFLIFNTMSMNIFERTNEIGVLRAMGLGRGRVVRMFVLEGGMLGLAGAAGGVVTGSLAAWAINASMITYHPPTVPYRAKLEVLVTGQPVLLLASAGACVLAALLASVLPALRAARMEVVDALRE